MPNAISKEQLELNRALHQQNDSFGKRPEAAGLAGNLALAVMRMHQLGLCKSILDYGTGKGLMVERLRQQLPKTINVVGYDPAVEQWSSKPTNHFDIVTCLDVLEHIEMKSIDAVLNDICTFTNHICYAAIDLQPAVKQLSDGRNAHILLAPPEWWITRFSQLFPCISSFPIKHSSGHLQKLIVVASKNPQTLPHVYSFINKMNIYNLVMKAGVLRG